MKATALILTAAAGLALAGCGSGEKVPSRGPAKRGALITTFTAPTTTTITNPQTGAALRCTNHGIAAGAHVPSAGHGVSGSADGKSASATLDLTRGKDGLLVVSCTP
ncbi:MAG TPA: hypothetical protein VE984_02890 [Gaiellaceae bacterium]|nr:hypothetical protein [Gaiellaceae bacterium]